jgi:ankyrin repeat protein
VCTLDSVDSEGNTPLHCACRGAKYDTIALLLEKYDAASVSDRNIHKKLPIDLLWESEAVSDRESNEYLDSIFRLLRSNPEMMMMNCNMNDKNLQAGSDGDSSQNNKKRKFDNVGR